MSLKIAKSGNLKQAIFKIGLYCGGVIGFAIIVYELMLVAIGRHYETGIPSLIPSVAILIIISVTAVFKLKRKTREVVKLKHTLLMGLMLGLISAAVVVSYKLVYSNLIEPDFYAKYIEANRESFYKTHAARHPGMTPERFDIDMAEGVRQFWKPQFTLTFIAHTILTMLTSLLTGLISRKKPK